MGAATGHPGFLSGGLKATIDPPFWVARRQPPTLGDQRAAPEVARGGARPP
jgi:hypothetical protein